MLIIIWIITAIIIFSIIILVHEFGHFKSARIFEVKVEEFWLWIPPKAKKIFTDKKWTIYTLNRLPLWWFVRLKWENWQDNSKDSLVSKKSWQQAIIILAWVFMNFILAIFIFSILFFIWVSPIWINNQIKINSDVKLIPTPEKALEIWLIIEKPWVYLIPTPDSIAKKSGIKDYDLVLKINDWEIKNHEELKNIISKNPENTLILEVKRSKNNCDITKNNTCDFENISVNITPNSEWKIWSYLVPNTEINKDFVYKYWFFESIKYGTFETYWQIILTFKWIGMLARKIFNPETPKEREEAIAQVSGPIGMVDFMTKSIGNGIIFILIIWAIISINLWVFNLLPIPALDGGRFLFILINGIIRNIFGKKAINETLEWIIHVGFFIFLIALSLLIAYNDVYKIINNG